MAKDPIEAILSRQGPQLSSDLCRELVEKHGLSPAAARQRVSRATEVKRLAYLPFPRNARFIYLQRDYGAPRFWDSLVRALFDSGSAYGGALAALTQRGGIMPKPHFFAGCGAPVAQKKHLSPKLILERLVKARLLTEIDVAGIGPCVAFRHEEPDYYAPLIAQMRARLVTEGILLRATRVWVKRLGLGSYSRVVIRGDSEKVPRVGTFEWDLTAPSYLAPLVEWSSKRPKPGFIVCDVLLGPEITSEGLRPFLQKCATLRSLSRVGKSLTLFIADKYSPEAFQQARGKGILAATPETLFGLEVAEALAKLSEVLIQAAHFSVRPDTFNELFDRLGRIEGAATNLRGALFEYVAADLMRTRFGGRVRVNEMFRSAAGQTAEVDVVAEEAFRRVHFIECKGYNCNSAVGDEEINRWLDTRIPLVRSEALLHREWRNRQLHFELWTTGRLSEASKSRIEAAKRAINPNKYTLDYRGPEGVRDLARELNDRALMDTLEKHFLEHPIATLERDLARRTKKKQPVTLDADLLDIVDQAMGGT